MNRVRLTAERLVEDACRLADEQGLERVTMSALARRAGVQTASLYTHVRSLRDLQTRMTLQALSELSDRLSVALSGRSGRDALTALAATYRSYAADHPGRYEAAHLRLDSPTARSSDGPRHVQLTGAVLRGYEVPEEEQVHAVRFIGATIHGYIELQRSSSFAHSQPDPEVSWQRCIDALHQLLSHWPTHRDEREGGSSGDHS